VYSDGKLIRSKKLHWIYAFVFQTADESSTHEKLDFWLSLPCSTFMIGRLSHRDTVTDLLSSGQLTKRRSMLLDVSEEFSQVCSVVC
jgi:hypothetical protein